MLQEGGAAMTIKTYGRCGYCGREDYLLDGACNRCNNTPEETIERLSEEYRQAKREFEQKLKELEQAIEALRAFHRHGRN
jgi:hypothetical protein